MTSTALTLSFAAVLCAVSPSCAQVLDPPPFKPEITIYGDSIAKSVGHFVCEIVKVADLDYTCRVVAKDGLGSPAIAKMIPKKPHDVHQRPKLADMLALSDRGTAAIERIEPGDLSGSRLSAMGAGPGAQGRDWVQ